MMKVGSFLISKDLCEVGFITRYDMGKIEVKYINKLGFSSFNRYKTREQVDEKWFVSPNVAYAAECMGLVEPGTWLK